MTESNFQNRRGLKGLMPTHFLTQRNQAGLFPHGFAFDQVSPILAFG